MCTRLPFIPWFIAGMPSSQALPGSLITAPPSACVPAVLGALAVWIQNQKKKLRVPRERLSYVIPREDFGRMFISSLGTHIFLK